MAEQIRARNPTVLMVDDEKEVADAYTIRLEGVAEVITAYGGEQALETIDEDDPPDVVLLDRHMPGLSGDDVLQEIRERELRTRVIMVTAIDPDMDILDLPFDDYLCKPVERADLMAAVDDQCQVLGYELLGEYFGLEAKRTVIESELPPGRLSDHDEFGELSERVTHLAARIERLLPDADTLLDDFSGIQREVR